VGVARALTTGEIAGVYEFLAVLVGDAAWGRIHVAAVVAFPRLADAPLSIGFGAAQADAAQAVEKATAECLQRLAFLWGDPVPEVEPEFSPTPDYHQDHFLWPRSHVLLRDWVAGRRPRRPLEWLPAAPTAAPSFVNLTPAAMVGKVVVVRAVCAGCLPLVFGRSPRGCPENDVHPVS
jgi:hypothetical protein